MEQTEPGGTSDVKSEVKNGNKKYLTAILVVFGVIAFVFGVRWFVFRLTFTSTDDAQVDADLLPISSKVPGRILQITVSEGDIVRSGQIIAEMEPTDYQLAFDRAEAKLEASRRKLEKAESYLALTMSRTRLGVLQSASSLDQSRGKVSISSTHQEINLTRLQKGLERSEVGLRRAEEQFEEIMALEEQAQTDLRRGKALYESGVISNEQYDRLSTNAKVMKGRLAQAEQGKADAEKGFEIARSDLASESIDKTQTGITKQDREKANFALTLSEAQQEQEVRMAQMDVKELQATVREMEAALEQAQVSLGETRIVSPVDGIVARKISLPVEIVPAGKPICFIVDRSGTWVDANIEETKLKNISLGSKARVAVDALPGRVYEGEVSAIGAAANSKFSLIPQSNPTGQFIKVTQRIPIKIRLSGDLSDLKPGMNAVVTIRNNQKVEPK